MAKARSGGKDRRKKEKRIVPHGVAHIKATFNNTLITISDPEGAVVSWSSAGTDRLQGVAQRELLLRPRWQGRTRLKMPGMWA